MASTSSLTAGELAVKLTLDSKAFYKDLKELEKAVEQLQAKYQAAANAVTTGNAGKKSSPAAAATTAVQASVDPALAAAIQDVATKLGALTGVMQQNAQQQQAYADGINKLLEAYQKQATAVAAASTAQQNAANAQKSATTAANQVTQATNASTAAANNSTRAKKSQVAAAQDAAAAAAALILKEADLAKAEGRWQDALDLTENALAQVQAQGKNRSFELTIEKRLVDLQADAEIQLAEAKGKRLAADAKLTDQSKRRATVENQVLNAAVLKAAEDRKAAAAIKDQTAQAQRYVQIEKELRAALDSSTAGVRAQSAARKELANIAKAQADQPKAAANAALEAARREATNLAMTQKDLAGAAEVLNNALSNQTTRLNASKTQIRETAQMLNSLKREMAGVTNAAATTSKVNQSDLDATRALSQAKILQSQYNYLAALERLAPAIKDVNVSEGVKNKLLERQAELLQRVTREEAEQFTNDPGAIESVRRAERDLNTVIANTRNALAEVSSTDEVKVLEAQLQNLRSAILQAEDAMKGFAASGSRAYTTATREEAALTRRVADAKLRLQTNALKSAEGFIEIRKQIVLTKLALAQLKNTAGPQAVARTLNEVQRASSKANIGMSVLRGAVGGVFGGFTAFSIIQTITRQLTQFTIESVKSANALEQTAYSMKIVARDTETYLKVMKLARDNQRLFGGSLQENIGNLTGFTLIARTAGVDLQTLVGVAQRLSLFDPVQGISGASTALREFLSGNIRSLRERFELPAEVLNRLSDASLTVEERLSTLSTFLDNQGLSMETLAGKMDLTAQAYQNFGIAWETTTNNLGAGLAKAFAPITQAFADAMDRMNNDADQLARDYYNLGANIILTSEQYQKGVELAANNVIADIDRMRIAFGAPIEVQLIATPQVVLPDIQTGYQANELDQLSANFTKIIQDVRDKAYELLKISPDLHQPIRQMFEEFNNSDRGLEALGRLINGVSALHNELIAVPKAIADAQGQLQAAFIINPQLEQYKKIIDEIIRNHPELSMSTWEVVEAFLAGKIEADLFAYGLNDLLEQSRAAADAAAEVDGEYKSLNLQFIEAQIKANDVERGQRLLTRAMDEGVDSAKLSGDQIKVLADLLGVEERKVEGLVNKWRELNFVRTLGADAADDLAVLAGLDMPEYARQAAVDKVFEKLYADFDFENTATDIQKLAKAESEYQAVLARYGNRNDAAAQAAVYAAFTKFKSLQLSLNRSSGSSMVSDTGTYLDKMKSVIFDYQKDVIDAETDFQETILKIQEDFYKKQEQALRDSELSKRRTRGSVYEQIGSSSLSQGEQQALSATYEEAHKKGMELIQAGNITQGTALIEKVADNIREDIRFMENINEALAAGDTAKADWWRTLYQYEKDAREIEMREILEGGDANVNEYNDSVRTAETEQADRIDAINMKFKDRAQELLASEPKIAELLNGTNTELSKQAEVLLKMADYTSPVERGLDGIASSANTALTEVRKLIDFMMTNNIGTSFTTGVTAGVQAGEDEVVDAAKGVVNAATEGAKDEIQARSPSRRTMREIGVPFVQGIAEGIAKTSANLNKVVTGVMNGAVKVANMELPPGIRKSQENIDAFKNFAQTNISILQGLRGLLPDKGGAAQGRASYVAAIAKIDQDTETQITARREKLSRDILLARTDQERRIIEAIAQQDIALLQQQANIQKSAQEEEMRNVADQESIDAKMSAIQASAAEKLKKLQERMAELAKTNPEEAARIYQLRAQQILDVANLRQELERYLLENNLTADDAYASLLRQQIAQVNALANMEIKGVGVGNAAINNTVYNINMDLTGSNLRKEDVRTIVKQELAKALSSSKGSTA